MKPTSAIEEQVAEFEKSVNRQIKNGGFLMDGTRAIDNLVVHEWLRTALTLAEERGAANIRKRVRDYYNTHSPADFDKWINMSPLPDHN